MALLNLILDTANPPRDLIISDYFTPTTYTIGSQVINDQNLGLSIQPVTSNPPGSFSIYAPDSEPTDSYQVGIGLAGQTAAGGTFALDVNGTTTNLTALAYDISAANLQTPLSAAFVTEGESACTVTLISEGAYRVLATTDGAVATGFLVGDGTNLSPDGTSAFIIEEDLGSVSTPYQYLILLRQSPMAYCEPSTALPAAGVTLTTTATGGATSDRIQKISFDASSTYDGTYKITCVAGALRQITEITVDATAAIVTIANHGFPNGATVVFAGTNSTPNIDGSRVVTVIDDDTFTVPVVTTVAGTQGTGQYTEDTTCGIAQPTISANALALILASHPQIFFNETDGTPDNIIVTQNGQDYFVQFTGSLGNSTAPSLTLTDIDLIAPQGVSGSLNLNTIPLNEYAFSITGDTFVVLIQIVRTRASGEVRTIFGPTSITIAKNILDPTSMVPPGLASYLTLAQALALFGGLATDNIWTEFNTFTTGPHPFLVDGTGDFDVTTTGDVSIQDFATMAIGGTGDVDIGNTGALTISGPTGLLVSTPSFFVAGFGLQVTPTATSYVVLSSDSIIGVTSTAAPRDVTLPNATLSQAQLFIVKDQSGGAAANNITVKSAGGTIDGVAAATGIPINTNYGSKTFYSNGTNWFTIT